ncbi:MAG: ribosome-associated translation inhibitor RaiA [Elusimicrobiota bacterium]
MLVNIRAKKLKVSAVLADYIKTKISKSEKYFSGINKVEVFLSKQRYLYTMEVIISITGRTIKIKQQAADFYSAADIISDKIEQRVKKEKEKMKSHRQSANFLADNKYLQSEQISIDLNKRKIKPSSSSVDEAIEILESNNYYTCWVFVNKDTKKLSVIYKKSDSNYELIEIIGG